MRTLTTIRQISKIKSITNCDNIELAHIDGWQCVVKKSEFKEGDYGIFFEIDSFIEEGRAEFEFLRKGCYKEIDGKKGFRIKTMKLKGVLSQGLLLPLTMFADIPKENLDDFFKVTVYEKIDLCLRGKMKGNFPYSIRKTNQERIQNDMSLYRNYREKKFEVTVKLNGSSMTVFLKDDKENPSKKEFGVCSHNCYFKDEGDNVFWRVAKELNLEELMRDKGFNIAIQGELMGPGIQGNKEGLKVHGFYVFDIWDIDSQCYLTSDERFEMLRSLGYTTHVPVVDYEIDILNRYPLGDLLEYANGMSLNSPIREGIVCKSCERINGQIVSFKVINNAYLLKEK